MTPDAHTLLARLAALVAADGPPSRLAVAFSGGRDSTVLLHALAVTRERTGLELAALHVDHGLHPDAADWETHCRRVAGRLDVPFEHRAAAVDRDAAGGTEAAARRARYTALEAMMQPGDWLLTAHHANDQAETLLMNLMRGSGVQGLSGIGETQPFGPGMLVRPLLRVTAAELGDYAARQCLEWIDDPSNADTAFDRNFLRHRVLPVLASRWPSAADRAAKSARLAGEARGLLDELAAADLEAAGVPERLSIAALDALSAARARNLVRYAARAAGLPTPPAERLERILTELKPARADAAPLVRWTGGEARRYRAHLYLLAPHPAGPGRQDALLLPDAPLPLGFAQGELSLARAASGIDPEVAARGLRVAYRRGGEALKPHGHDCTRTLKKLLQQHGVVPWMRPRIPLLYADDALVAVADLWVAEEHHTAHGYAVHWESRPPLA